MAQIDLKNATIKIKDGGANELTIKIGEGNLTWTEKKPRKYVKNRGNLDTVVDEDQEPVELRFDLVWEFLKASSGGTPTPHDAIKQRREASGWASTDSDACAPYAVDIELTHTVPCTDSTEDETITFSDFRWETLEQDLRNGTLSVSGMCNITEPTVTRS